MPASNYEFGFDQLRSISESTGNDAAYVQWFKDRAIDYAGRAAAKIRKISALSTPGDPGEVWGDHCNPEYELRRAKATLTALEERLDESVSFFENKPLIAKPLKEALERVKSLRHEVKDDLKKAEKWF